MPSIVFTLSGCGFTPYSINSLPPKLKEIYCQTENPYDSLTINFKKRLQIAGAKLLAAPKKSAPTIKLTSSYNSTSVSNPASSTQARIHNLNYTATITINDFHGKQLLTPQVVSITRSVTLQPNEVFEATTQTPIIKNEIQQELITRIFNILCAQKTFQALKYLSI